MFLKILKLVCGFLRLPVVIVGAMGAAGGFKLAIAPGTPERRGMARLRVVMLAVIRHPRRVDGRSSDLELDCRDGPMSNEPTDGRREFKKLLATCGVMYAIAAVTGLLAWLSTFWTR
jgi:hypothetical protein